MAFLDGRLKEIIKNISVKKLTNTPKMVILLFLIIIFGLTLIVILNADKRTKEEVAYTDIKVEETDEYDDKFVKNQADLLGYKKNESEKIPKNLKEEEFNKIFANDPALQRNKQKNNEEEFLNEFGLSDEEMNTTKESLNTLENELNNISKNIPKLPVLVLLDKETNMYSISGLSEKFFNGKKREDKYLTQEQRQALAEQELAEENARKQELANALKSATLVVSNTGNPNDTTDKLANINRIDNITFNKDVLDSDFKLNKQLEAGLEGEIKTGFVIPATLLTEIESQLKGMVVGQVRQNIYDTATGQMLLIPQGTKLVGDYQSDVQYGAKRLFINWKRLVFPNGNSLDIGTMPGADMAGISGFKDKYNTHFWEMFGSSLLFSFVLAGVNLTQTPDMFDQFLPLYSRGAAGALSEGVGQSLGETMSQMIRKNLNIAPDLTIRAGYLFNIMITKDIVLPEYSE